MAGRRGGRVAGRNGGGRNGSRGNISMTQAELNNLIQQYVAPIERDQEVAHQGHGGNLITPTLIPYLLSCDVRFMTRVACCNRGCSS